LKFKDDGGGNWLLRSGSINTLVGTGKVY
jgi:hypothetical protein